MVDFSQEWLFDRTWLSEICCTMPMEFLRFVTEFLADFLAEHLFTKNVLFKTESCQECTNLMVWNFTFSVE